MKGDGDPPRCWRCKTFWHPDQVNIGVRFNHDVADFECASRYRCSLRRALTEDLKKLTERSAA